MFRRLLVTATVLAALTLLLVPAAVADDDDVATYRVTITNLTDGQPLTPPVVATHSKRFQVFEVGDPARFELKEIAENGNNAPLLAALAGARRVFDSTQAGAGPLVPDGTPGSAMFEDSVTFTITANKRAKFLSFVSMLICTNDGFTGIDGIRLPKEVGHKVTVSTAGYDAGTEINTEDFADIVPPCQGLIGVSSDDPGTGMSNPALAEGDVIRHHPGIQGGDDLLVDVHAWEDPVARVVIERIDVDDDHDDDSDDSDDDHEDDDHDDA